MEKIKLLSLQKVLHFSNRKLHNYLHNFPFTERDCYLTVVIITASGCRKPQLPLSEIEVDVRSFLQSNPGVV